MTGDIDTGELRVATTQTHTKVLYHVCVARRLEGEAEGEQEGERERVQRGEDV